MPLFLTSVLPFLAHNRPSAVAFLTCRHHNFHSSIIPEFLSDEERVKSFCSARQQHELRADQTREYIKFYYLFVQTPLMQFSPSLVLRHHTCAESIIKPLLATKYFTRTLQRCSIGFDVYSQTTALSDDLCHALSQIQSLTKLDLYGLDNGHLEIIINSFPSLETLSIEVAKELRSESAAGMNNIFSSPPPTVTRTLRTLKMNKVDALFASQFVPHFSNMRELKLSAHNPLEKLDLRLLLSSLPLLTDLTLIWFTLDCMEPLKNLVHLSSLRFKWCKMSDVSFLTQENSLPALNTFGIDDCDGLSSSSFTSLSHALDLHVLQVVDREFNNDCLQYLENMVHLRKLDLSESKITGDCRSLKTLIQNLCQLEELNLRSCHVGSQGAIAGALYSTHSRLRVLNLGFCDLVDDDLNGIGALKNTLEVLHLSFNGKLTNESLLRCKDLAKLKVMTLSENERMDDLAPLKDCVSLEELDVSRCAGLTDDSFRIFSAEPNSFPNLHVLILSRCENLSHVVLEHLSKNNYLVYQLKELDVDGMSEIPESSSTARNNLCQLQGLRKLKGICDSISSSELEQSKLKDELMGSLKNLEEIN